jgi:serine/threonine protein kinase
LKIEEIVRDIYPEALQISQLKHKNITKYYEHFTDQDENYLNIVYEYCEVSNSRELQLKKNIIKLIYT